MTEDHWTALIKIVEGGLEGDPRKVRAYTELLTDQELDVTQRQARES